MPIKLLNMAKLKKRTQKQSTCCTRRRYVLDLEKEIVNDMQGEIEKVLCKVKDGKRYNIWIGMVVDHYDIGAKIRDSVRAIMDDARKIQMFPSPAGWAVRVLVQGRKPKRSKRLENEESKHDQV